MLCEHVWDAQKLFSVSFSIDALKSGDSCKNESWALYSLRRTRGRAKCRSSNTHATRAKTSLKLWFLAKTRPFARSAAAKISRLNCPFSRFPQKDRRLRRSLDPAGRAAILAAQAPAPFLTWIELNFTFSSILRSTPVPSHGNSRKFSSHPF